MAKVKRKEHEKLDGPNIEQVIALREQEKPISIKAACEILNIASNGPRLQKIIDEYKEDKEREAKRRAANRGKPAELHEIQAIINDYLDGDAVNDIAKRIYRSTGFVNKIVEEVGIPQRVMGHSYVSPPVVPEKCISETFEPGQLVWDMRWNGMAIIIKESPSKAEYKVYQVYQIEAIEEIPAERRYFPGIENYGGRYANTPAFDLCNLEHLKNYGVDVYKPYRSTFPKMLQGR